MLKSMLQHLRDTRAAELEGEGAGEAGFTLIELMVVLLIIAILLAIAIPTFLGVTSGANDRAAQSNLTNAYTESAAAYQNQGQCFGTVSSGTCASTNTPALAAIMSTTAPEFTWASTASTGQGVISVAPSSDGQAVSLAVLSKTGNCWFLYNSQVTSTADGTAGTYYGEAKSGSGVSCLASNATATNTTGSSYSTASTVGSAG